MNLQGPIVVIDDDQDDRHILGMVFKDLNYTNEVMFFKDGASALDYLKQTNVYPFLILSDINMPRMDGFELRSLIQNNTELRTKCIPYMFISTSVSEKTVREAYETPVQGYFVKPANYDELTATVRRIVEYWRLSFAPSSFRQNSE